MFEFLVYFIQIHEILITFAQQCMSDKLYFVQVVANEGADALYSGSRLASFVKSINDSGGVMSENDLKQYQVSVSSGVKETTLSGECIIFLPPATLLGIGLLAIHIIIFASIRFMWCLFD